MQFKSYHSIENSYRKEFLEIIKSTLSADGEWCVTEKVHGSNFQFTTSGDTVTVGSRTKYLVTDADFKDFFACQDLVKKINPKILQLFDELKKEIPDISTVTVFGELFGGLFPGMKSNRKCIQKGVSYTPDHEFYAFDIRYDKKDEISYLNYDKALELFRRVGLFYADILFRGTLDECLEWSSKHNADDSTIPHLLGMNPSPNNIREGHVVKPINHATTLRGNSVILKDKNAKFAEKASEPRNKPVLSEEELKAQNKFEKLAEDLATIYITQQRLDSVVSKHGPEIVKNIGKALGFVVQDALQDYEKEKTPETQVSEIASSDFVEIQRFSENEVPIKEVKKAFTNRARTIVMQNQ